MIGSDEIRTPCKNCTDRVANCHSVCASFKEYQKKKDDYKKGLKESFVNGNWGSYRIGLFDRLNEKRTKKRIE